MQWLITNSLYITTMTIRRHGNHNIRHTFITPNQTISVVYDTTIHPTSNIDVSKEMKGMQRSQQIH